MWSERTRNEKNERPQAKNSIEKSLKKLPYPLRCIAKVKTALDVATPWPTRRLASP
jgi:hypothetical protein